MNVNNRREKKHWIHMTMTIVSKMIKPIMIFELMEGLNDDDLYEDGENDDYDEHNNHYVYVVTIMVVMPTMDYCTTDLSYVITFSTPN